MIKAHWKRTWQSVVDQCIDMLRPSDDKRHVSHIESNDVLCVFVCVCVYECEYRSNCQAINHKPFLL